MIIYKCFSCDFESNNDKLLKSKQPGQLYLCPDCQQSNGCLVDAETQMEFPDDYMYKREKGIHAPLYYGSIINQLNDKTQIVALQIFELIDIKESKFKYGYVNVPGMYFTINEPYAHLNSGKTAVVGIVGKNVMTTYESKNPKSQLGDDLGKKSPDDFITGKTINPIELTELKQRNKILIDENFNLLRKVNGLDLYKILSFDIPYLLTCGISFKKLYKLPKPTKNRIIKKYGATKTVTYGDLTMLNKSWDKNEIYYMDLPDLNHIESWLKKAWNSGAICCGVVPFAPYTDWYKYYIAQRADGNPIKEQKGIPFPCMEFSFRYDKTKPKKKKDTGLMTKEDKKMGQTMFGFAKREVKNGN